MTPAPLDYGRSFVSFVLPGRANHARIAAEARCLLTPADGPPHEIVLVASCKAENTYADGDLFRLPSYDFCALFSRATDGRPHAYRIVRTPLTHDPAVGESGPVSPRFEALVFQLRESPGAERLETPAAVVEATLAGRPLVGRTHLAHNGATALLEYPIKTMNVRAADAGWQVDTGPLLAPADAGWDGALAGLDLAFIAFADGTPAELLLRRPARVGEERVDFYGERRVVAASNEVWAL